MRRKLDVLIRNIAGGDRDSFRHLYDLCSRPIFLYALSYTKDYQTAEDVMQETFLSVLKYAATYQKQTSPKSWLYTIARNACVQAVKKAERDVSNIDDHAHSVAHTDEPFADSVTEIEALKVLSPTETQIVSLHVFAGLRLTEIAGVMELPYGQIRSKYSYAMRKLKQYYNQRGTTV